MAFPWGMVLLGAFLWAVLRATPRPPTPSPQNISNFNEFVDDQHGGLVFSAPYTFPLDEVDEADSMEKLRVQYLKERDRTANNKEELSRTNPVVYWRMEELERNITAMESDLKAKYLFFNQVLKRVNESTDGDELSKHAASIIMDAVNDVPETSRQSVVDFLNFIEKSGSETSYKSSDEDAAMGESMPAIPQFPSASDAANDELKRSLRPVEIILTAANNSLPIGLQERDPLTLTIHVIHMARISPNPLTFSDMKPIFLALNKSSDDISEYLRPNPPSSSSWDSNPYNFETTPYPKSEEPSHPTALEMAFPWDVVLIGVLLWAVLPATPKPPTPSPQNIPNFNEFVDDQHGGFVFNAPYTFQLDEVNETDSMGKLRVQYLKERDRTANNKEELSRTNPVVYWRMEELERNITAMESDLKAKYLFFNQVLKRVNESTEGDELSKHAASIITDAVNDVPETSRQSVVDFLNFIEKSGSETSYETTAPSDEDAAMGELMPAIPQFASASDAAKDELKRSLRPVEIILTAANNSLPIGLQEKDPLTLTIHVIHMARISPNPLTFSDMKPIFLALNKSSDDISQYLRPNPSSSSHHDRYATSSYSTSKVGAKELDFLAIMMSDALEKLCDIATKITICGSTLKSYFEFHFGDKAKYSTDIGSIFQNVGKIAKAAKFC